MLKKLIIVLITLAVFHAFLMMAFAEPEVKSPDIIGDLIKRVESIENYYNSTAVMFSIILTTASFIATIAGLALAFYGYFNIKRADKIAEKKVKEKLSEFSQEIQDMFNKSEEASQKLNAAYRLQAEGKLDAAIDLYKKAIEISPRIFNGYTALGYAYLQKNAYADALIMFNKAAELFSDRIESFNDLARVHAILKNKNGCIDNIKKMASLDKSSIKYLKDDDVFKDVISFDEIQRIYDNV